MLIAGGGPVGLVLACVLRLHGVACRVIDRAPHRSADSRATDIHARTLEGFAQLGVAKELIARGKRVFAFNAFAGGRRISRLDFRGIDTPFPYTVAVPQSETEAILEARLHQLGGEIERSVELISFEERGSHVQAVLRDGSGREERVNCRWLVGCDGIGSTVRRGLGLPFSGISYSERYFVADATIEWQLPENEVHLFMTDAGFFNVVALPGARRGRILCDFPAGSHEAPSLSLFQRALEERTGMAARLSEPTFMSSFRIQRRIVPAYRVRSVFLAGDAAHTCSPLLGQGMNVGIQDAHNLGWKLALVARGAARQSILDSYDRERRPVARTVLLRTHFAHGVSRLGGKLAPKIRDVACRVISKLPAARARAAKICTALDVEYSGSPIVAPGAGMRACGEGSIGSGYVVLVAAEHAALRAELEARYDVVRTREGRIDGAAVCVVRPDGYVAYRADALDRAALFAYLDRVLV